MVVTILICSLGFFLLCGILFLVFPVSFSCSWKYDLPGFAVDALVFYIHPMILKAEVDSQNYMVSVIALNRFRLFSYSQKEEPNEKTGMIEKDDEEDVIEDSFEPDIDKKEHSGSFASEIVKEKKAEGKPKKIQSEKTHRSGEKSVKEPLKEVEKEKKEKRLFFDATPIKKLLVFANNPLWRGKVFRWLKTSIKRFFSIVSIPFFRVRVRAGFEDPAQTGTAFGYYIAAINMLGDVNTKKRQIVFEPTFNHEPFETDGKIKVATSIGRLLMPLVLAVVTFPYLHTYLLMRRAKRINKNQE